MKDRISKKEMADILFKANQAIQIMKQVRQMYLDTLGQPEWPKRIDISEYSIAHGFIESTTTDLEYLSWILGEYVKRGE